MSQSETISPVTIGPCTLYLGDCLKIAPTLEGVDAVISDPPYGMDWDTDTTRFSGGKHVVSRGKDWGAPITQDSQPFDPLPWIDYPRVVLFWSNHFSERLQVGTTLVWVKRNDNAFQSFLSDAEVAWMKNGHGVYCFRDVRKNNDSGCHPTQKPVAVMAWCMKMAKVPVGATVLDPFMGSGTTGIACIRTGRRFIGIEIDPKHFNTACKRIQIEVDQLQLPLVSDPQPIQADLIA